MAVQSKPRKLSPLRKLKIQRSAGQTLHGKAFDHVAYGLIAGGFIIGAALTQLIALVLFLLPIAPGIKIAIPIVLLAMLVIPLWVVLKCVDKEMKNLTLGMRGEQYVAGELEALRPIGYRAFHSLNMGKYDIDHVLIGPAGVFAVETKTYSKTHGQGRNEKITYDGQSIRIASRPPDTKTLRQAKANACALRDLLKKEAGLDLWVTPLITYPGWWIDTTTPTRDVLVLNPKMISKTLLSLPVTLDPPTINKLVTAMEEHQGEVYEG